MRASAAWACAVLAVTAACEPDPCVHAGSTATLEVGTGHEAFTPLTNGDSAPYVRGIQGGTHVDGALRARGLTMPDDPQAHPDRLPVVSFTVHDDAGALVGGYRDEPRAFAAIDGADDVDVLLGELVIFLEDAAARVGHTLRLRGQVADQCGAVADDARTFVLAAPVP